LVVLVVSKRHNIHIEAFQRFVACKASPLSQVGTRIHIQFHGSKRKAEGRGLLAHELHFCPGLLAKSMVERHDKWSVPQNRQDMHEHHGVHATGDSHGHLTADQPRLLTERSNPLRQLRNLLSFPRLKFIGQGERDHDSPIVIGVNPTAMLMPALSALVDNTLLPRVNFECHRNQNTPAIGGAIPWNAIHMEGA
jgi:hypothetical protein